MSACRIVDAEHDVNEKKASVHKLRDAFAELNQLQNEHKERINSCDEDIKNFKKFKDDYLHLQKRLTSLPDKTSHEVMVPIGSLAFMPGRLVHTNEIIVLLGDNWFAERSTKQAAGIVSRRIRDVDEKMQSMEAVRQLHENWLKEAEELSQGNAGEQVEIIEGPFDDQEVQKSREDTKRMLKEHNKKLKEDNRKIKPKETSQKNTKKSKKINNKENSLDTSAVTVNISKEVTNKDVTNCEDKTHEDLMSRLDQLCLQEEANRELDSDNDIEDVDEIEMHKEQNEKNIKKGVKPETEDLSDDLSEESEDLTEESEDLTEESEDEELEHYENTEEETVSKRPPLKRRVSWADEKPPYEKIIPDDNSEDIFRIQYTPSKVCNVDRESSSVNQNEDSENAVYHNINSPSDLYKVFSSGKSTPQSSWPETKKTAHDIDSSPRGILKNPSPKRSLQSQKVLTDEHGWRYATECIEAVSEDSSDTIARPPTPPLYTQQSQSPILEENSQDTHTLQPAFKYSVVAREEQDSKGAEPLIAAKTSDSTNPEPKKISRFKASRLNKT